MSRHSPTPQSPSTLSIHSLKSTLLSHINDSSNTISAQHRTYFPVPLDYIRDLSEDSPPIPLSRIVYLIRVFENDPVSNIASHQNIALDGPYIPRLKPNLEENVDFILVKRDHFQFLRNTFGVDRDELVLKLNVVLDGVQKVPTVELHPLLVRIAVIENIWDIGGLTLSSEDFSGALQNDISLSIDDSNAEDSSLPNGHSHAGISTPHEPILTQHSPSTPDRVLSSAPSSNNVSDHESSSSSLHNHQTNGIANESKSSRSSSSSLNAIVQYNIQPVSLQSTHHSNQQNTTPPKFSEIDPRDNSVQVENTHQNEFSVQKDTQIIEISRHGTIKDLRELIQNIFYWDSDVNFRLWNAFEMENTRLMLQNDASMEKMGIVHNQLLLVEIHAQSGWPLEGYVQTDSLDQHSNDIRLLSPSKRKSMQVKFTGFIDRVKRMGNRKSTTLTKGACGLRNLGNTCFMNASIQCLSNTEELTKYFLQHHYLMDLNAKNPLGMKGKLAKSYAKLMKNMWSGSEVATPMKFKYIISQFAPQFGGMRQHDAHELLSFLLDGLHEDLNRVRKKPYVELKEANGRDDTIVSKEAWEDHLCRNQSIIVDLFQAQLKSTLVCPDCSHVSIKFEPFMYLTLAVPESNLRHIAVLVMNSNPLLPRFGSRPTKYSIPVTEKSLLGFVKQKFSDLYGLPASEFIFADMEGFCVKRLLSDKDTVQELKTKDKVLCFQKPPQDTLEDRTYVRCCQTYCSQKHEITPLGIPFLLSVPLQLTGKELYGLVASYTRRFTDQHHPESFHNFHFHIVMKQDPFEIYGDMVEPDETVVHFPQDEKHLCIEWIHRTFLSDEARTVAIHHDSVHTARRESEHDLNLTDCLKLFSETEQLSAEDVWFCSKCKAHKEAYKKFQIWSLPEILIIHIKRFFQRSPHFWEKMNMKIDFPVDELDMSSFLVNPPESEEESSAKYELFALVNHSGRMNSGHYTSFAKNQSTGTWYNFNDSTVTPVHDIKSLVTNKAYILFYRRKKKTNRFIDLKLHTSNLGNSGSLNGGIPQSPQHQRTPSTPKSPSIRKFFSGK